MRRLYTLQQMSLMQGFSSKMQSMGKQIKEIQIKKAGAAAEFLLLSIQPIRQTEVHNIYFEWNEGGHFHEIPKRFTRAIAWCACQS